METEWFYEELGDDRIDGIMEAEGESGTEYEIRPFGQSFLLIEKREDRNGQPKRGRVLASDRNTEDRDAVDSLQEEVERIENRKQSEAEEYTGEQQ